MEVSDPPAESTPRRLLFLVHVDWRWIKQRPHFLAEEATKSGNHVVVLFKPHLSRFRLPRNESPVRHLPMLPVPHSVRHRWRAWLGRRIQRSYVGFWARRFKPDVVYVSHPLLWSVLPDRVRRRSAVLYDCMDDAVAMARPDERRDIADLEAQLVESASVVSASSAHLVQLLGDRCARADVHLIRNGIAKDFAGVRPQQPISAEPDAVKVASYVGTIAHWMDWEALMTLRDEFEGVIRLIGPRPAAGVVPPGIECGGPVEHSAVFGILEGSDLLLLPFSPGDVVAAVDPVKLYEYVAARRPIVARYFPELERFRPFVSFYERSEEIGAAAATALSATLPDEEAVSDFLRDQDWSQRWGAMALLIPRESEEPHT